MQITNDDGPPSDQSSPYVHSLVSTLQQHGHTVSVVLPHTQRSWIGKAHLVGKSVRLCLPLTGYTEIELCLQATHRSNPPTTALHRCKPPPKVVSQITAPPITLRCHRTVPKKSGSWSTRHPLHVYKLVSITTSRREAQLTSSYLAPTMDATAQPSFLSVAEQSAAQWKQLSVVSSR